jgi:hypothetical protein
MRIDTYHSSEMVSSQPSFEPEISSERRQCYGKPLKGRNIRLLQIHPGHGDAILECSLQERPLNCGIPYQALSYVWGDPSITRTILCDGHHLKITENLHSALWLFCDEQNPNFIWADAICISQADVEEKTEQLQVIKDVYAKADLVIVWLGPTRELYSAAISLLRHIVATIKLPEDYHWLFLQYLDFKSLGIDTAEQCLADLCELVFRPYFYRIWIIQEVLANHNCVLRCGSRAIERDDMLKLGAVLIKFYNLHHYLCVSKHVLATTQTFNIFPPWFLKHEFDKGNTFTLNTLLANTIPYKATNPKDKIFTLVSFSQDVDASFINYKLDLNEVLIRIVKLALMDRSFAKVLLNLLSHACYNEAQNGMPSKVPL